MSMSSRERLGCVEGVGGSLRAGEPSLLGVFGELFRPLNSRPNLPPRPVAALLKESSCSAAWSSGCTSPVHIPSLKKTERFCEVRKHSPGSCQRGRPGPPVGACRALMTLQVKLPAAMSPCQPCVAEQPKACNARGFQEVPYHLLLLFLLLAACGGAWLAVASVLHERTAYFEHPLLRAFDSSAA